MPDFYECSSPKYSILMTRSWNKWLRLVAVVSVVLALTPLPARAGESLVNSDVDVDITGKDAVDAREQAMLKGHADALAELLGKFTTPEQITQIITNLDPTKINA